MKNAICTAIGTVGSVVAGYFGGWDAALTTLIIFMGVDYVTGLMVAAIFHKSKKTKSGRVESKASFKGLCRKSVVLMFVLIGARLDIVVGANYIRDAICFGFMANELVSIIENAGLMGIPLPDILSDAIELLTSKSKCNSVSNNNNNNNNDKNKEEK